LAIWAVKRLIRCGEVDDKFYREAVCRPVVEPVH